MNYWLIKSEPGSYSIDDLARDRRTSWNGVRNYQARNFMKAMKKGDKVLFYHSSTDPSAVVGIAEVVKQAYPDDTALDSKSNYYDPKSTKQKPIWEMVDIKYTLTFKEPVTLTEIKRLPALSGILLAQPGSRLSVLPVLPEHFAIIARLGSGKQPR